MYGFPGGPPRPGMPPPPGMFPMPGFPFPPGMPPPGFPMGPGGPFPFPGMAPPPHFMHGMLGAPPFMLAQQAVPQIAAGSVIPRPMLGGATNRVVPHQSKQKDDRHGGGKEEVTLWVGKYPANLDDALVKRMVTAAGHVAKWKRATDPETNRSKPFGFVTYSSEASASRALRLLHGLQLGAEPGSAKAEAEGAGAPVGLPAGVFEVQVKADGAVQDKLAKYERSVGLRPPVTPVPAAAEGAAAPGEGAGAGLAGTEAPQEQPKLSADVESADAKARVEILEVQRLYLQWAWATSVDTAAARPVKGAEDKRGERGREEGKEGGYKAILERKEAERRRVEQDRLEREVERTRALARDRERDKEREATKALAQAAAAAAGKGKDKDGEPGEEGALPERSSRRRRDSRSSSRSRSRDRHARRPSRRSRSRSHERERERDRDRRRSRSRDRYRTTRRRSRSRERSHSRDRERSRGDRDRHRDRSRSRDKDRERERGGGRGKDKEQDRERDKERERQGEERNGKARVASEDGEVAPEALVSPAAPIMPVPAPAALGPAVSVVDAGDDEDGEVQDLPQGVPIPVPVPMAVPAPVQSLPQPPEPVQLVPVLADGINWTALSEDQSSVLSLEGPAWAWLVTCTQRYLGSAETDLCQFILEEVVAGVQRAKGGVPAGELQAVVAGLPTAASLGAEMVDVLEEGAEPTVTGLWHILRTGKAPAE